MPLLFPKIKPGDFVKPVAVVSHYGVYEKWWFETGVAYTIGFSPYYCDRSIKYWALGPGPGMVATVAAVQHDNRSKFIGIIPQELCVDLN